MDGVRVKALWLLLLLLTSTGCAVDQGKIYIKDGKQYGVTSSLTWRGTWWNYYERGSSYAEGEFWQDAIADFDAAIKQREVDQRRARTYGLHFLDYFPHRELGVVYYRLRRHSDAIRELETSLQAVESAKAKFYLNKARQALFGQTGRDTPPPGILVDGPPDGLLTNRFTLTVRGRAEAAAYVSGIAINGRSLFIELAEPSLAFAQDITLHEGLNAINIVAVDLLGRLARQRLTIDADRQGPLLSVGRVELLGEPSHQRGRVEGALSDRSRVVRFLLAGQSVPLRSGGEWEFREEVPLGAGMGTLPFEAEDAAGNVTRGEIALSLTESGPPGIRKGEPPQEVLPRWALLKPGTIASDLTPLLPTPIRVAQGSAHGLPVIKLTDLAVQQTVYYDTVYLEGKVVGASPITGFWINGESLWRRKSQQLFFGHLVALKPGDNQFLLEATDEMRNTARQEIVVTRQVQEVRRLASRLRVTLLPPAKKGQPSVLAEAVYDHLFNAFVNQRRFDFFERQQLEAILREQKLSQTELVDPATAARIGKIIGVEGILMVSVTETPQAVEIFARFVDVETSAVLAAEDVYGEDLTLQALRTFAEGLAVKFRRRLPLVEGVVVKTEGRQVFVDLGEKQAIKKYMKLLLFREGEPFKHPLTGKPLGTSTQTLGEARVEAVLEDFSQATMLQPGSSAEVRQLDKVITK
jgi:hypothetical protein